jgi:flagellar motor switch protein FliN/FliY
MADEAEAGAARSASEAAGTRRAPGAASLDFVLDVPLRLTVEIGSARMLVRDVLQLGKGSVVELDRMTGEPADVYVNERLVARGEVTVVEQRLAVKIVEIVDRGAAPRRGS